MMASVFMVYRGSLLRGRVSMWLGSLVTLGGMSPMLDGLLVRRLVVSNQTRQVSGHDVIGNRQTIVHQLVLRRLDLVDG